MPADISFLVIGGGLGGPLFDAFLDEITAGESLRDFVPGKELGSFVIDSRIGAGGSSVVFLAHRKDAFAQQVAIKVSMADAGEHRFQMERNLLARLEHRSIVRIIDGGETDGLAWAAMEFVDGEHIDRFCDKHTLDWRVRLTLIRDVADALHYAHQRQIVHGDIKPSNILVDADHIPRLLDFGVAHVLFGKESADRPRACTPSYASPEQLRGDVLTTAADVYQVGRLIEGVIPLQIIASRSASRNLKALLDCILKDDAAERPASMAAVRDDIDRILRGLPCRSAAWSMLSRLQYAVQRNQRLIAIGAAVVLCAGTAVALVNSRLTLEKSRSAEIAHAATVSDEFFRNLFRMAAPTQGSSATIVDVLDQGAERLLEIVGKTPLDRAILIQTLGSAYLDVERPDHALKVVNRFEGMAHEGQEIPSLLRAQLLIIRAWAELGTGATNAARQTTQQIEPLLVLDSRPAAQSARMNVVRLNARIARSDGDQDKAVAVLQRGLASNPKAAAMERARAESDLSGVYLISDRKQDALAAEERAVALAETAFGKDAPPALQMQRRLAYVLSATGSPEKARALLDQQEVTILRSYGNDSIEHAILLNDRGVAAIRQNEFEEAVKYLREDLRIRDRNGVGRTAVAASTRHNLAGALAELGQLDEAIQLLRDALAIRRQTLSDREQVVLMNQLDLSLALCLAKQFDASRREFDQALSAYRLAIGGASAMFAVTRDRLQCLVDHGQRREALALFEREFGSGGNQSVSAARHRELLSLFGVTGH